MFNNESFALPFDNLIGNSPYIPSQLGDTKESKKRGRNERKTVNIK